MNKLQTGNIQGSSGNTRLFVIIGIVVALLVAAGLVVYFVSRSDDTATDQEQPTSEESEEAGESEETDEGDDGDSADDQEETDGSDGDDQEGADGDDDTADEAEEGAEDDATTQLKAIIAELEASNERMAAAAEACDQAAATAEGPVIEDLFSRVNALTGQVSAPTQEQTDLLNRFNALIETSAELSMPLSTCGLGG